MVTTQSTRAISMSEWLAPVAPVKKSLAEEHKRMKMIDDLYNRNGQCTFCLLTANLPDLARHVEEKHGISPEEAIRIRW